MGTVDRVNRMFNHEGARTLWLRIRIPVGILFVCLLCRQVRLEYFGHALAISLFGEAIQLWCFAALNKGRSVASQGPYALVHNPMYLGRYFIIVGFLVLLGELGLWLLLPHTVFYWFYMRNRVAREEEYLEKVLGLEYADYCRRVHRFLPSTRGLAAGALLFWDWALFRRNHGWSNAMGLLAVYAVFHLVGRMVG